MATQTIPYPTVKGAASAPIDGYPASYAAAYRWPVLKRYGPDSLARVALPIGGIGTGTISLGGRGALRAAPVGEAAVTRCLEGPIDASLYEGSSGATAATHGLPRFRHCAFEAAYPLGQVALADPDVPLLVRLQAFNPLIPGDTDASGVPVAVLRVVLLNTTDRPIDASVCGVLQNFIGDDGTNGAPRRNANEFRRGRSIAGVFMRSDGVDPAAEQWGTLTLATPTYGVPPAEIGNSVSYRSAWQRLKWGNTLLDFWEDFAADGALDDRLADGVDAPVASLARSTSVPAGGTAAITFLLTWHFPNRQSWTPGGVPKPHHSGGGRFDAGGPTIGNYYCTRYDDAWDVATYAAVALPDLERQTVQFVESFVTSDLPDVVKEAALFNLSTLRTQTCFRTSDGHFFGWEGIHDRHGSCYGNCTHVWNYEQATAFLFGDLARDMRRLEFLHATGEDGHMAFRLPLPLDLPEAIEQTRRNIAAADGQMGCLMKLYRDWQLSGDDAFLREVWPPARKALEYCWVPGGWDADRDGVMEGCQHNTMDVEYFGPNLQMSGWYLGALRAAEEMARHLGEHDFAATCRELFERGRRWIDAHLFNGEYYEHEIRPPMDASRIAPRLRRPEKSAENMVDPELQLGAGCLVDQLVGQYVAHVCGLGYLLDPEQVRTTLRSILRHNRKTHFYDHFNPMRSYVVGDEPALLMASYPRGRRPRQPFPYYAEVMTGFEYAAAVHMLYEGLLDEGLQVIEDIRSRYDGRKRNPFDEAECGHHYARAMASWAAVIALTGYHYSAVEQTLAFAAAPERSEPTTWFWSTGAAWGAVTQTRHAGQIEVELASMHGAITIRHLTLTGFGALGLDRPTTITAGLPRRFAVPAERASSSQRLTERH